MSRPSRPGSPENIPPCIISPVENVPFGLTREFDREGTIAVLTSGQAVVHRRTVIMSEGGKMSWVEHGA